MNRATHVSGKISWLLMLCLMLVTGVGTVDGFQQQTAATQRSANRLVRYATALLHQYDTNKDGSLDEIEVNKMRRPIKNADSNGDGKVELAEIISRLFPASKNENSQVQPGGDKTSDNVNNASKYADSLIEQYDANSDGVLDVEELAKMRRPPRADADVDADGTVNRQELVAAILNRKQSQALLDLMGGTSGNLLSNMPPGVVEEIKSRIGPTNEAEEPANASTTNNDSPQTRVARISFCLLQLDENIEPAKLNKLAGKISQSDEEGLKSLLGEFAGEQVYSNDQVYTTLLSNRQFTYQGGGTESQITGRSARRDGALLYDTRDVDVGFHLSLSPEFEGDRIRLGVEVSKSFIDMNAKPASDRGVLIPPIRNFKLQTELLLSSRESAASVFSGSGHQWLVVVSGQFE